MELDPSIARTTLLLKRCTGGERTAEEELFAHLYGELRAVAGMLMRRQPADHVLQPTALVHEAWMKIAAHAPDASSRSCFVRLAARAMRNVLVDEARARTRDKRGGGARGVPLEDVEAAACTVDEDVLDLHDALEALRAVDEDLARIAELRLFAGLEHEEIAAVLGVSTRTAERAWSAARTWLRKRLAAHEAGE